MTLHISLVGPDSTMGLKLDGRLTTEEVPELWRACAELTGQLTLDLTDLQFADRTGASVLRELKAHGAMFTGVSPYIELLIGDVPLDAAN
jgi:ABC-type transporter Mla MlaB component